MTAAPNATPNNIREQLIRDEGLRLRPYYCPAGKLTLGVGHNLDAKPITRRAAFVILEDDIQDVEAALCQALPWTRDLDGARFGALVNVAFAAGVGGLLGFRRMLLAAKLARWPVAAEELLDSDFARGAPARAARLADQLLTGEWR